LFLNGDISQERQRGKSDVSNLIEMDPLELNQRYAVYSIRNTVENGSIFMEEQ